MESFIRLVAAASRLCGVAAALMLLISVLVVCQMVFVRYVLEGSTYWQTEFVTYLLIASTFVGSPYVLLTRGHVNVDLLPMYLGPRSRFVLALIGALASLVFCVMVTVYGGLRWHEAWGHGEISDTIWGVRLWIPYAAMPIGFGMLSLQYLADILSLVTGREPPFGMPPSED